MQFSILNTPTFICSMFCSMQRHQSKMPLRLFKALPAQTNLHVLMEKLAARITLEAIVAVRFLMLFVVKAWLPVALMQTLAVKVVVVVLFLMLFVVKTALAVASMDGNVMTKGVVSGHIFCLC